MSATLEVLSTTECLDLLRQQPIGRIGISIDALPVIFPVRYAVVGNGIMFRTNAGTKLAAATNKAVVAFEVDSYEEDGQTGWSVVVQGIASEVNDTGLHEDFLKAPGGAWAVGGSAQHVVRIELHNITGRRFAAERTPTTGA